MKNCATKSASFPKTEWCFLLKQGVQQVNFSLASSLVTWWQLMTMINQHPGTCLSNGSFVIFSKVALHVNELRIAVFASALCWSGKCSHVLSSFLTNSHLLDSVIALATKDLALGMLQQPIQKQLNRSHVESFGLSVILPITSLTVASLLDDKLMTLLSATDWTFWQCRKRRFVFCFWDKSSTTGPVTSPSTWPGNDTTWCHT